MTSDDRGGEQRRLELKERRPDEGMDEMKGDGERCGGRPGGDQ